MSSPIRCKETDELVAAFLTLKTKDDIYNFLEDVATIQEIKDFTMRLQVAKLLHEKVTYTEIVAQTGASATTIARVNKALMYGAGGYQQVLTKNKKIEK